MKIAGVIQCEYSTSQYYSENIFLVLIGLELVNVIRCSAIDIDLLNSLAVTTDKTETTTMQQPEITTVNQDTLIDILNLFNYLVQLSESILSSADATQETTTASIQQDTTALIQSTTMADMVSISLTTWLI